MVDTEFDIVVDTEVVEIVVELQEELELVPELVCCKLLLFCWKRKLSIDEKKWKKFVKILNF